MPFRGMSGRRLRYLLRPTAERVVILLAFVVLVVIVLAMDSSS